MSHRSEGLDRADGRGVGREMTPDQNMTFVAKYDGKRYVVE